VEDIHSAASADKDTGKENSEGIEEEQPVPTFEEAVAGFEMVQHYVTSFPIDNG
jgi:hypothetical protein